MASEEMAKNKANNNHSVNKPHRLQLIRRINCRSSYERSEEWQMYLRSNYIGNGSADQRLQIGRTSKLYMHLTLDESSARDFRKARGQYLRSKQWNDISVHVYIF